MRRLLRALAAALLVVVAALPTAAQEWPGRDWPVSTPEQEGMSSAALARLVAFGQTGDIDSLLVIRHGRVVLDATYAPFRDGLKHRLNSATKSVVSTLVAIALADGALKGTDQKLVDLLPGRTIANLDADKQAITLQHLLDMTSGLEWPEGLSGLPTRIIAMEQSPDWVQHVLDSKMATPPGARFNYSSGGSHLLSAILSQATGKSALDYARNKLFGPLGISDVTWRADPQGVSIGGYGLYLKPHDAARLGYLYLRDGVWQGRRIVPAAWIAAIRNADVDMRESWATELRYGRQFWVIPKRNIFMMVGFDRQLVMVMPRLDMVVVTTGSARYPGAGVPPTTPRYDFEALLALVAGAVKADGALPDDPAGRAELTARIATVRAGLDVAGRNRAVSGRAWRLEPNALNIGRLTLHLDAEAPRYAYTLARPLPGVTAETDGGWGGPIGLDGRWAVGGQRPFGPSAARGQWTDDGRYVLELQSVGNDDATRLVFRFAERTVEIRATLAIGGPEITLRGQAAD